ncbi:MAG: hypothetical protein ACLGSD_09705 [Acidobacteriota bacterium]
MILRLRSGQALNPTDQYLSDPGSGAPKVVLSRLSADEVCAIGGAYGGHGVGLADAAGGERMSAGRGAHATAGWEAGATPAKCVPSAVPTL